jgi:hypothetical protein
VKKLASTSGRGTAVSFYTRSLALDSTIASKVTPILSIKLMGLRPTPMYLCPVVMMRLLKSGELKTKSKLKKV